MNNFGSRTLLVWIFACVALASGCATITGSETQSIAVETVDKSGAPVTGADCNLTNNRGSWKVKSPGHATVNRSAEDLTVQCQAEDQDPGMARAVSRANAGMFGNIIFGGGIGAIIDHNKGTAYDYPDFIRVVFGASRVFDKNDPAAATAATTPAPSQSPAPPAPAPRPAGGQVTVDDLKDLLPATK
jgi:hypothetical protein